MTDFETITACGESCINCPKKLDGRCPGCIESDGHVPEWAESGRCRVHACVKEHHARFCGLCPEFPCEKLPALIHWNPGIIDQMTALRDEYRLKQSADRMKSQEGKRDMNYLFESARLGMRRFRPEDAEQLYAIHLDGEVKQWIPNESYEDLNEAKEAAAFFGECVDRNELPYVLAIEIKDTGELIGDIGINEVEGKSDEVEIGFVICREYRGKGYATEAVQAMKGFAVSAFQTKMLYGRVMKGNNASVRVLEKDGYHFVTEESGAEDDPCGNGMLVYQKLIRETDK